MQRSETVETMHGKVEYETVECDMCGNHIQESEAVPITTNAKMEKRWGGMEVKHGYRRNMCSFCAESFFDQRTAKGAIVTSPWQVFVERLRQTEDPMFALMTGFAFGLIGVVVGSMILELLALLL